MIVSDCFRLKILRCSMFANVFVATEENPFAVPAMGKPYYGVYFQEVVPSLPLYARIIRELKHFGYKGLEGSLELEDSDTQYSLRVGDGTSRTDAVVPGIPARWTKGDTKAMLADMAHYTIRKCDVAAGLKDIGISLKGLTMKAVNKQ
jgi:hypothetical protein